LAEWLYEAGIGETRAALVEDDRILEAAIEPDDAAIRHATVLDVRLAERLSPALARVEWPGGAGMLDRPPSGLTLGRTLRARVVREAVPEGRRCKLPKLVVAPNEAATPGPDLLSRCRSSGLTVRVLSPHDPDRLEAAGWSEMLGEAETGELPFPGGLLRIALTPAMTVIDVDGLPPLAPLSSAAATAAGAAIRRFGIGGSIGIDFPTLANKAERQAVADALDAALPPPFERTAVNGFGFVQIVRPRLRPSLPELLLADPVAAAGRAALRQLGRLTPGQPAPVRLPAPVLARIEAAGWRTTLVRRLGFDPLESR